MLQKLNERIQGIFAWVIISLIAVTFAMFGVDYYMQSRQAALAKAEVNGEAISIRDFDLNYRRSQNQHDPAELTAAGEAARKQDVLEGMIRQNLALQSARHNGFWVSLLQASAVIQSIPEFLQDGRFSASRFQQVISNALFTPEAFQKEVQQGILVNQQQFAIRGTEFALWDELDAFVKLAMQTRDYDYLVIPVKQFEPSTEMAETAIEQYYQSHKNEFVTPEQVVLDYVRLSMHDFKKTLVVPEEQIKHYYDDNKSNFNTPAAWQVAHILLALPANATPTEQQAVEHKADELFQLLQKDPGQFESLVKTRSDDKLSVLQSGVLPWIVAGQSAYDKALVNLTQVGQLSAPIKTSHGYEIFKLIAYKPAQQRSFADVKQTIHDQLMMDLVQSKYTRALEQLSDLSYQSPDSLTPVADALHLKVERSLPMTRSGSNEEWTKNPRVIQAAFSADVMKQGNNSEPVQIDNDTVIVLRLAKHLPATQQALAEVRLTIEQRLRLQQAELKVKAIGQQVIDLKLHPEQQQTLLDRLQLKWQHVSKSTRKNKKVAPAINDLAFSLGKLYDIHGTSSPGGDYILVRLTQIDNGQLKQLDQQTQHQLLQQIESRYANVEYDLFLMNLVKLAKIIRY